MVISQQPINYEHVISFFLFAPLFLGPLGLRPFDKLRVSGNIKTSLSFLQTLLFVLLASTPLRSA